MVALSDACIVHEEPFATAVPGTIVIPHGVEERATPSRDEARAALGLDDRLVVLCFGFLAPRSEEHTSEPQSLMRISYAVFCLKKKNPLPPHNQAQNSYTTPQK